VRVLDLFAGLKGWSEPWAEHGHDVITLDIEPEFECTLTVDIFDFKPSQHLPKGWHPDVILASPPCEGFSVMNIGTNWTKPTDPIPNAPRTEAARMALAMVERARDLIADLEPTFFVIENPRAKLRRLPVIADLEQVTVTYCRYGLTMMKPTDLWGGFPISWRPKPKCSTDPKASYFDEEGVEWRVDKVTRKPCHHAAARGARTGVQANLSPAERGKIPRQLSLSIMRAAERDL
jgi:hypothetical protein